MIKINNVSKFYTERKSIFEKSKINILNEINFLINEAEIVGLIGLNGSGKSTLLKCMSGVICCSEGDVLIDTLDVFKERKIVNQKYGVFFNNKTSFLDDISVKDNFELVTSLYRLEKNDIDEVMHIINTFLNIDELWDLQYRKLSYGQRVRCEIASILIHKPSVIMLDEPSNGLDANVKMKLKECLKFFNLKYNTTIVFVTHDLEFIEDLASRVLLLDKGNLIYDQTFHLFKEIKNRNKKLALSYQNLRVPISELKEKCDIDWMDQHKIVINLNDVIDENQFIAEMLIYLDMINAEVVYNNMKEIIEVIINEYNLLHKENFNH